MYKCGNCGSLLDGTETVCAGCGKRVAFPKKPAEVSESAQQVKPFPKGESSYSAGGLAELFTTIFAMFVSAVTFGLAAPGMICWKKAWRCRHTYINGKQLFFVGKGINLFGKMLLWGLLSVITLGIYGALAVPVEFRKWMDKNTHFEGEENAVSEFNGSVIGMLGINLLTGLLSGLGVVTLGGTICLAMCVREKWLKKHQIIDGYQVAFNGTSLPLFGLSILWTILGNVTFQIFNIWRVVLQENWFMQNTFLVEEEA